MVIAVSALAAVFGMVAGYSALLGGLVSWIATAYFAWKVLIDGDRGSAQSLLPRWYFAEFIKIAMAAVLLAAAYTVFEVNALALIGGFFVVYVGASITSAAAIMPVGKANEHGC